MNNAENEVKLIYEVDEECLGHIEESHPGYEKIQFSGRNINMNHVAFLASAFRKATAVKSVTFHGIPLQDSWTVSSLITALFGNQSLKEITFHSAKMGNDGLRNIASALKNNTSLESLTIANNGVTDIGALALADALRARTKLKMLSLPLCNGIGQRGYQALADALTVNNTLETLNFGSNEILNEHDFLHVFADAMAKNSTLTTLNFRLNNQRSEPYVKLKALIDASLCRAKLSRDIQAIMNKSDDLPKIKGKYGEEFVGSLMAFFEMGADNGAAQKEVAMKILDGLNEIAKNQNFNYDSLPDTAYLQEFIRLTTGVVDVMNAHDADAQINAFNCFIHPFVDEKLQAMANANLIKVINNDLVFNFLKRRAERKDLDLLLLSLSIQYPGVEGLLPMALAASHRLRGDEGEKFTLGIAIESLKLDESVLQAQFREQLNGEVRKHSHRDLSLRLLLIECRKRIVAAFEDLSLSAPGAYGLFEPRIQSRSPILGMNEQTPPKPN